MGVSPVLFYDPVGRVVATLHPNHTWEKVVFDAWRQATWDVNDTVSIPDPKTDPDVGEYFRRLPEAEYLPTWYAQRAGGAMGTEEQAAAVKAAVHAETPSVAHLDSLGRTFLTVAHNRLERSGTPLPGDPPTEASTAPGLSSTSKATSAKSSTPWTASSCATTMTCSVTSSIPPAWMPASAGC